MYPTPLLLILPPWAQLWSRIGSTTRDESCVLSKMDEMKNVQGTSMQASLWAIAMQDR